MQNKYLFIYLQYIIVINHFINPLNFIYHEKNLSIFGGMGFLLLCCVTFIAGINQNNLSQLTQANINVYVEVKQMVVFPEAPVPLLVLSAAI